jgi:Na+/H+ antiporter NhaA
MRSIGFIMLGVAIAMFVLARPRHGKVVQWLRSDNRQWAYGMAVVILIAVGFTLSLFG